MANEIQLIHDDGAETVYAIVRDMLGNWYHGTNPEAFDDANWGDYDIALIEVHAASSGNVAVQATFPAVAAGFYWLDVYVQAGANPAQTDYRVCSCLWYWNGTTLVPAGGAADVRQINASAPAAANVASVFLGTGDVDDVDLVMRNFHVFSDTDHAVRTESTANDKDGLHCEGIRNGQNNIGGAYGLYNYGYSGDGQVNQGIIGNGQTNIGGSVGQSNYGVVSDIYLTGTGTFLNSSGNVVQIGAAAALAAYDSNGGVAKEASVGAIATILAGITSLAHWLRGLYNKRTMNSAALAEIQDTTGTFDPTTDSAEALRDRGDAAWITPTGFATPTNITAASGVSLAANQHVIVDSGTVTSLTNAPPDSAGVTTLLARIGAFTGTTVNTVLGFFRALFRKDSGATLPSDIGGTFDNATDSNEALADKTGGLTAQETRNALKLAPSTGTPAAGSVDAELDAIDTVVDAIKVKTDTIGSGRITYASTVGEASLATLWAGDDYRAADGTQFSITVTDYAGPSLATATAVLRIMDSVQYLSAVDGVSVKADLQVAATIAIDGTTITLAADLTAAQTAAFESSPPQLAHNYVYEFVCTLANGHIGYRTHGRMTVKKAIAAGV